MWPPPKRSSKQPKELEAPKKKKRQKATVQLAVTVSIGVAERSDDNPTSEMVVKAADEAMYRAKKKGRNRVAK